jgi:hypothetical protein
MQTVMIRGRVLSYLLLSGLYAVAYAAEQTITRTVEHFTLGMPKDQAFAVLLAGIKQHHLTLEDQAQTPSQALMERLEHTPMDAVGQPWIAPQSADVLYTLNALLFDAQEFKDPVVNIALSAQVEQSLSWRSPTAQSMYLVLYQSHVFGIFVLPLASYESTKKDCVTMYGPSQASIYHKSYGFAFVQGEQHVFVCVKSQAFGRLIYPQGKVLPDRTGQWTVESMYATPGGTYETFLVVTTSAEAAAMRRDQHARKYGMRELPPGTERLGTAIVVTRE